MILPNERLIEKAESDPDTLVMIMNIQVQIAQRTLKLGFSAVSEADLVEASEEIHEVTGLDLDEHAITSLLTAHPRLVANIKENGVLDTEVRAELIDTLCVFLCGCEWTDHPAIRKLLHNQALAIFGDLHVDTCYDA